MTSKVYHEWKIKEAILFHLALSLYSIATFNSKLSTQEFLLDFVFLTLSLEWRLEILLLLFDCVMISNSTFQFISEICLSLTVLILVILLLFRSSLIKQFFKYLSATSAIFVNFWSKSALLSYLRFFIFYNRGIL